jgi:putative heme-binding domain-containing protein
MDMLRLRRLHMSIRARSCIFNVVTVALFGGLNIAAYAQTNSVRPNASATNGAPLRPKSEYQKFAMAHQGDSARGKQLFHDQRAGCAKCHSADGKSRNVGPDLLSIGDKFGRRDLIDAVLNPSAVIAVGYSTVRVTTRNGNDYEGIISHSNDSVVELMQAESKKVRIEVREILQRGISELSLMPEGIHQALSLQEFADVIGFWPVSKRQLRRRGLIAECRP